MATNGRDADPDELVKLCHIWDDTESLTVDFEQLLNSGKFSDVEFVVGEKEQGFGAHSLFLKSRCLKFQDDKCNLDSAIHKESWRPEVFEKVLRYIYTGKIQLSSSTALETLRIAAELSIPKLISKCEEYFLMELSVENCCEFYMDAINMRGDCSMGTDLVNLCQSFVEDNACDVIQTQGFRQLSKDALIRLISSDKFSLEEEDVWRAVFKWSKHQAKVEMAVEDWTDYDRAGVCKYLCDVIGHVQLLLVDSKVFAEEIEPTGAVPMELSLERYRYAAVPQKFDHHDDIRIRPRVYTKKFHGTTILWKNNSKYQAILNNCLGPTFGAGPDLSIAHHCNVNTDSCSRLPHSYGGEVVSNTSLMGAATFKIADYEVFVPKERIT